LLYLFPKKRRGDGKKRRVKKLPSVSRRPMCKNRQEKGNALKRVLSRRIKKRVEWGSTVRAKLQSRHARVGKRHGVKRERTVKGITGLVETYRINRWQRRRKRVGKVKRK